MIFTTEQLQEIQDFAEMLLSPDDIAIILGIPPSEFLPEVLTAGSQAFNAFMKGKLLTESKLNKTIIAVANQGSSPAQSLVKKMIEEQNLKLFHANR